MIHTCRNHLVVVHADGSDVRHTLLGVLCPCLPKVFCAVCDALFFAGGVEPGRAGFITVDNTTHVYPAWQDDAPR
jgi:hypothetical protein